jgi:excisionase family DNA binding protein
MSKLMSPREVAEFLNVSVRFIYERTAPKAVDPIPHVKLGKFVRFRLNEVEK